MDQFREDGVIARLFEEGLEGYEASESFKTGIDQLLTAMLQELNSQLDSHPEALTDSMATALQGIAGYLRQNPEILRAVSGRLKTALLTMIISMRGPVRAYVAETVANWDSDDLVNRIEAEVAVISSSSELTARFLGAILGGALFTVSHFLF